MSLPMFDPPDYPYKDLHESLIYDSDRLMFNVGAINDTVPLCTNNAIAEVTEEMISDIENTLSFSNDNGRYFNNIKVLDNIAEHEQSTELYIVQSENQLNYEPTLLDENTVNQFLLPLKVTTDGEKVELEDTEDKGSDLLSLHSCVMCHEVFMTDVALLDHTIAMHTSASGADMLPNGASVNQQELNVIGETSVASANYESEWLVCSICGRVLSTALEIKPSEQLCCDNGNGNCSISTRKLDTMFVCDLCSGLFADGVALDRHRQHCNLPVQQDQYTDQAINSSTDKNSSQIPEVCYSCDICEKQFTSAEQLKLHVVECQRPVTRRVRRAYTSTPNNKMWNCGSCNQLFATARELYRHKRGEDRPPGAPLMAYVCEECDKVLGSMCALHTHKKMHKVSKPGYPCRICGRLFNQSGHLAIHMRMHTGERPYPCDLCPKAFKVKVERDDHRRTHTGERPFACTNCPKTFTAAARLREHARIHTDQRPYQCDICGAAFRRPYARTVHTLIHTGEKPHECDICGTAFRRSGDMWKHKRTIHSVQSLCTENVE